MGNNYYIEYRHRLKFEVLCHYGGTPPQCECCGESAVEFLCIDHINGDGNNHRKRIGGNSRMYNWLKKNNFPSGFRVLCYNCNSSIGAWGYCPHKDGSQFKVIKTLAERTRQSILNAAKEIYDKGLYPSMNMVSELAGVSKQVVCKYRKKMLEGGEWPCPIRGYIHRGESHPNSILDVTKVKKIRKLISQGYSNEQIGVKIGVSRSTIRDIRKGITWKHVHHLQETGII